MAVREYWTTGTGFTNISWVPEYKECKDETMRSGNHFQAKKSEAGEWTCETCGGESMDFELFEEFGDINGCLQLGVGKDPSEGNPKTPLEHVDVQRARKHIEDMKSAMEKVGESAEKATYELKSAIGETITSWTIDDDGTTTFSSIPTSSHTPISTTPLKLSGKAVFISAPPKTVERSWLSKILRKGTA